MPTAKASSSRSGSCRTTGEPFAFTEDRRREFERRRGAVSARAAKVGDSVRAVLVQNQMGTSRRRHAPRRGGDPLHACRSRGRHVVLRDVFTQPVGKHVLQVCRTLSCALLRGRAGYRGANASAGHQARRNRCHGHVHARRGRVPRRLRPGPGRDGERRAGTSASRPRTCRRCSTTSRARRRVLSAASQGRSADGQAQGSVPDVRDLSR